MPVSEFFSLFEEGKAQDYDFALSTYVASERYPAVQLRYLLNGRAPPIGTEMDLIDSPETSEERMKKLTHFQKKLLEQQLVVPLFFVKTHIVYQTHLLIGKQPVTDADIHLWKVTRK